LSKRIRPSKVQQEKKRILLDSILNKWVCFKQSTNNDERYVFMKHTLRDGRSYSKVEQIVLSNNPVESGVYYITDYEIDRVLDITKNSEIIEFTPVRYDLEIGLMSSKIRFDDSEDMFSYLVQEGYVSQRELDLYTNNNDTSNNLEEVYLSFAI